MSIKLITYHVHYLKHLSKTLFTLALISSNVFAAHKHKPISLAHIKPSPPTKSVSGTPRTINNVKATWYGSAGRCSTKRPCYIAYARVNGYSSVFHNIATEGSGTAQDPITLAANKTAFPIGTLVYIPTFRKYFIFEDKCPRCGNGKNKPLHIDLYQGPTFKGHGKSLRKCAVKMNALDISIIIHPDKNLPVETTPILTAKGVCTGKKF